MTPKNILMKKRMKKNEMKNSKQMFLTTKTHSE